MIYPIPDQLIAAINDRKTQIYSSLDSGPPRPCDMVELVWLNRLLRNYTTHYESTEYEDKVAKTILFIASL